MEKVQKHELQIKYENKRVGLVSSVKHKNGPILG